MTPLNNKFIAGDIGGTNARMTLFHVTDFNSKERSKLLFRKDYKTAEFNSLAQIVNLFIEEIISSSLVTSGEIKLGVFCVAGPVTQVGTCKMTNSPWIISKSELEKDTPLSYVHIQNDFKSVGYGILDLFPSEYLTLHDVPVIPGKVIAVIGAGTGLGQCFITFDDHGDRYVHSSEGGHIDLFVNSAEDFEIYQHFVASLNKNEEKYTHVSIERLLSGSGLAELYNFYNNKYNNKTKRNEETLKDINTLKEKGKLPIAVTKYAFNNQDIICYKSVIKFIEYYGRQAGNVALNVLPKGGIYVAGGVLLKILGNCTSEEEKTEVLDCFKKNFFMKARMNKVLDIIQLNIVLTEDLGVIGVSYVGKRYLTKMNSGEI
eukprot:GAHX01000307.1.p1 GENE.GAHX01000307.1~~GAHX01000307.1.p1  ORF type:complete len:374 (+),score=71.80 GAHX01000307.1:63-1184(+)